MKGETCEKGATWTDWIPTPSPAFRRTRSVILRTRFLISSDMRVNDLTITQSDFSGTC